MLKSYPWLNQFDEFQTNLLVNIVFESRSIKLSSILELLKKKLSYVNLAALPHTYRGALPHVESELLRQRNKSGGEGWGK